MLPFLYEAASYKACFLASTLGSLMYQCLKLFWFQSGMKPLLTSNVTPQPGGNLGPQLLFIALSVVLGLLCGILAGSFVKAHHAMSMIVGAYRRKFPGRAFDIILLAFVAVAGTTLAHFRPLCRMGPGALVSTLFHTDFTELHGQELGYSGLSSLFLFYGLHVAVALSVAVPCGCVAPLLVLGATAGRLYGQCLPQNIVDFMAAAEPQGVPDTFGQLQTRLAIVGAAAMTAGVCHTMSIVVMVFELIAVPGLILPMSLATLTSMAYARKISLSIFDSILMIKKLPGLPTLNASHRAFLTVGSQMHTNLEDITLHLRSSAEDVARVFAAVKAEGEAGPRTVAIVRPVNSFLVLVGAIDTVHLPSLESAVAEKKTTGQSATPATRHTEHDVVKIGHELGILSTPVSITADLSLKDAYLRAQIRHHDSTMMVIHPDNTLVGMLTRHDLNKVQ